MSYTELYQRNLGAFTEEEQNKLKAAHVFIAGVGGVGGIQAITLARLGVGEITIMDPGVFDEPDLNRQYGAMFSTLGKNKARATGDLLCDIAPFTKINVFDKQLNEKELRGQIRKSTLVVNAIDMGEFAYQSMFAKIAREEGKYNLACPIPDFGAVLMVFDPDGMSFEKFTNNRRFPPIFEIAKNIYKKQSEDKVISNEMDSIPFISSISSNSCAAALSGGFLATEAVLIITGKRTQNDILVVPHVTYIDFFDRFFKVFNPLENT